MKKFKVTRLFIGGTLKDLTYTEVTSVPWKLGQVVSKPIGGSPYKIVDVQEIPVSKPNQN